MSITVYSGLGAVEYVPASFPVPTGVDESMIELALAAANTLPSEWQAPDTVAIVAKTCTAALLVGNGHLNPITGVYWLWHRAVSGPETLIAPYRSTRVNVINADGTPIVELGPFVKLPDADVPAGDVFVSDGESGGSWQSQSGGTGTVDSVTPGDATITIGGTASAPTVAVTPGTFDASGDASTAQTAAVAAAHTDAAGQITALGLGTASTHSASDFSGSPAGTAGKPLAADAAIPESQVTNLATDLAAKLAASDARVLPSPTLANAGKVATVKADGSGYEVDTPSAATPPALGVYASGYLPCAQTSNNAFSGMNNGQLFFLPLVIAKSTQLDRITVSVRTAGATGSVVRLGIYADSGRATPGALVLDAGTVTSATTGIKEITIAQTLSPGLYWACAVAQGAPATNPALNAVSPTGTQIPMLWATYTTIPTDSQTPCVTYSSSPGGSATTTTTGALPATSPGTAVGGAAVGPNIFVRVV